MVFLSTNRTSCNDRLEWSFLEVMMRKLGFSVRLGLLELDMCYVSLKCNSS